MMLSLLGKRMLLWGLLHVCMCVWGGLAEGEYKELMWKGFKQLNLECELHDNCFSIHDDSGVAVYQYIPPVQAERSIVAVVCIEGGKDEGRMRQWRRSCQERARELVFRKWLEKIYNHLEENINKRIENTFPPLGDYPVGTQNEVVQAIYGYPSEFLAQSFDMFDMGCLCLGLRSNGLLVCNDCEVRLENGKNARFFSSQFQIFSLKLEDGAGILKAFQQDYNQVAVALRGNLNRRLQAIVGEIREDIWTKNEADDMRRIILLLYALDPAAQKWAVFASPVCAPDFFQNKNAWCNLVKTLFL